MKEIADKVHRETESANKDTARATANPAGWRTDSGSPVKGQEREEVESSLAEDILKSTVS
jgi:hypothetical protein